MPRNWSIRLARVALRTGLVVFLALSPVRLLAQDGRKVIAHPAPVYPETAKKMSIAGSVKVQVVIAADGHIKETKVIGGHPMLVAAVEDTLHGWKYAPSNAETTTILEFNFHP